MARNYDSTALFGASNTNRLTEKPPHWMNVTDSSEEGETIQEWAGDITQHKVVNLAYGDGTDPSEFSMSENRNMVVTMEGEEVTTVSDRFNLVDNPRVLAVAVDVLQNLDLSDKVFGEGRDYRSKFFVDLFFNDSDMITTAPDSTTSKMAYGISIAAANDKSSSIRVCPSVWDGESKTLIRGISDGWKRLKHTKEEDVQSKDMYDKIAYNITRTVVSLPDVAEEFLEQTEKAESFPVYFESEDFNIEEFYKTWLGDQVPQKVIDTAVHRSQIREGLITEGSDPFDNPSLSMWSLVSGFTYAYTHASSVSDGPTKKGYHDTARDALQNPEETLIQVRKDYVVEDEGESAEESQEIEGEMKTVDKTATVQEELRKINPN